MANIDMNFDAADLWEEMSAFCEDMLVDRLHEYIHEDDLECQLANMIEEKEIITADMVCDVTQFEDRLNDIEINNQSMIDNEKVMWSAIKEAQEAINTLCDRSISKKAKINDIAGQMLKDGEVIWAAIKDLQFNHSRWAEENHTLRQRLVCIQAECDYLHEQLTHILETRLSFRLSLLWDNMTSWIRRKFRG